MQNISQTGTRRRLALLIHVTELTGGSPEGFIETVGSNQVISFRGVFQLVSGLKMLQDGTAQPKPEEKFRWLTLDEARECASDAEPQGEAPHIFLVHIMNCQHESLQGELNWLTHRRPNTFFRSVLELIALINKGCQEEGSL